MNMKTIILALLFLLGDLSHARELGALYVVEAKPSQIHETGVLRANQLSLDSIRKRESQLGDYRRVTVIGSVARSGVYFSKAPIHLLDIIDQAGELKEENGAGSHRNVSVVIGDDIVTYDITKLREMKENEAAPENRSSS